MSANITAPCRSCGINMDLRPYRTHDNPICEACEVAERYEKRIDVLTDERDEAREALRKLVDLKRLKERLPHVVEPDTARRVYLADRETSWAEAFRIVDAAPLLTPAALASQCRGVPGGVPVFAPHCGACGLDHNGPCA